MKIVEVYSELMKALLSGKFVYTAEIEAGKTSNLEGIIEKARRLKGYVAAINITDNSEACAHMNPLIPSYAIQRDAGIETVYQLTCRDHNRLALTLDLLATAALGIKNILVMTGDYVTLDDPETKTHFRLRLCNTILPGKENG